MPKERSTPKGKRDVAELVTNRLPPVLTAPQLASFYRMLSAVLARRHLPFSSESHVQTRSPGIFLKLEVYCEPCADIGVPQHPFKLFEVDPARIHLGVLFLHFQEGLVNDLSELVLVEVLGDLKPKTPGTQPSDC